MKIIALLTLCVWMSAGDLLANVVGGSVFVEGNAKCPSISLNGSVRSETLISNKLTARDVATTELITKRLSAKNSQIDVSAGVMSSSEGRSCCGDLAGRQPPIRKYSRWLRLTV